MQATVEMVANLSGAQIRDSHDFPNYSLLYLPVYAKHAHIRKYELAHMLFASGDWDAMCASISDEVRYRQIQTCDTCNWLDAAIRRAGTYAACKLQDKRDEHMAKVHLEF